MQDSIFLWLLLHCCHRQNRPIISSPKTYSPVYSKVYSPSWHDTTKHRKTLFLQLTAVYLNRLIFYILLSCGLDLLFWQPWKWEVFFSYFGPLKWKSILDKIIIVYFLNISITSSLWVTTRSWGKWKILKTENLFFQLKQSRVFWNSLEL